MGQSHPSLDPAASLDPEDWGDLRAQGHRMLDDMFDHLEQIRTQPVWQAPTPEMRQRFRADLPWAPQDLATTHAQFQADIAPYSSGNAHPGFMGWVQGGGTAVGMLAEMLAAGLNANLGGRDHMPIEVERQVVTWMAELFGFPKDASGLFLTGTSQANMCAVLIARTRALGAAVRTEGVAGGELVAYTSRAAHNCIERAMDMAGLGSDNLRQIETDAADRISLPALRRAIAEDRAAGRRPFLIVGTAGTVDIGAIDDLEGLGRIARDEDIAFHVDGAFGALGKLSAQIAPKLAGIELADSLAFDFHKWGQVPYDAGFLLVRDPVLHRATFASEAAYLRHAERGLAGGDWWPCDLGPDLSRGFRALKVWFTLKTYGLDALGAAIARTCDLAQRLAERVAAEPELELMAPVELNIVCFGYRGAFDLNAAIAADLQEAGRLAPSTTTIGGRTAIRAAIVNHRTGPEDIEALVDHTLALGRAAASRPALQDSMTPDALPAEPPRILGLSHLAQLIFDEADIQSLWTQLVERATAEPADPAALFDLSTLLFLSGQADQGLAVQAQALEMSPLYRRVHGDGSGLKVLAIFTPGGMMANTPLDFLLEGSDIHLDLLYIGQDVPLPTDIPDHDVAFLAIGESSANVQVLSTLGPVLAAWPQPVVNAAPQEIAGLTRDGVVAMFRGSQHVLAPVTSRLDRRHVVAIAQGEAGLGDHLPGSAFPIIIRPIDSHAGQALEKIDGAQDLAAYLEANDPGEFYVTAFEDYSGPDGLYRKQRIAFFAGVPYVSHMAVSSHWMVHYLSAEMAERAERRAEEALFMAEFDETFAVRHAQAFAEMHAAFGLDYFAIDCAETKDGRLLLFEADVAMIIHAMDSEELYPYKKPAMRKLFAAFQAMLARAAKRAEASASIAA